MGRARRLPQEGHPARARETVRIQSQHAVGAADTGSTREASLRYRRKKRTADRPFRNALGRNHLEHPAPLRRDRVRLRSPRARGVHASARVHDMRRTKAQARIASGHAWGAEYRRPCPALDHRRAQLLRERSGSNERQAGTRSRDRCSDSQGSTRAPSLPERRRTGVPDTRALGRVTLRGRSAAHTSRDANWIAARRRPLHPRRAFHRFAPARQRTPAQHSPTAPRPRQHCHRRRAR